MKFVAAEEGGLWDTEHYSYKFDGPAKSLHFGILNSSQSHFVEN